MTSRRAPDVSEESEQLLVLIREFVHGRCRPEQEEIVVEIVGRTVVTIMSDARFYSRLSFVMDQQAQIKFLLQQVNGLQQLVAAYQSRVTPPRKPPPPKPKKKTQKRPALPHNVRQFKRGVSGE